MLVNLTPHTVVLRTEESDWTLPPSGQVARVSMGETQVGALEGIPIITRRPGPVVGLPDSESGTLYLVSAMVLEAAPADRTDLLAPDTGATAIRDGEGRIVAVTRLVTR